MGIIFDGSSTEPTDLRGLIGQALGAGSVCWTDRVFDSERASALVDEVVEWIEDNYVLKQIPAIQDVDGRHKRA